MVFLPGMDDAYHIRIQQVNYPELVLAFPATSSDLVDRLFQQQYRTGREFLDSLSTNKQSMLEAIASGFNQPTKNFVYSIGNDGGKDKLKLTIFGTIQTGQVVYPIQNGDLNIMSLMALLIGNYRYITNQIDPDEGPIDIRQTYDDKIDELFIQTGMKALNELLNILSSPENYIPRSSLQNTDEEPQQQIILSDFIKPERILLKSK